MKLDSACRALLSGATLLATTAMAAPGSAPPPLSPCLEQHQSATKDKPAAEQQHHRWRSPCFLADAEKPEHEQENDGVDIDQDVRRRLDEIDMLSRLGTSPETEPQWLWIPSDNYVTRGSPVHSEIPAVPEPANAAMLVAGLALLAGLATRRRRKPEACIVSVDTAQPEARR